MSIRQLWSMYRGLESSMGGANAQKIVEAAQQFKKTGKVENLVLNLSGGEVRALSRLNNSEMAMISEQFAPKTCCNKAMTKIKLSAEKILDSIMFNLKCKTKNGTEVLENLETNGYAGSNGLICTVKGSSKETKGIVNLGINTNGKRGTFELCEKDGRTTLNFGNDSQNIISGSASATSEFFAKIMEKMPQEIRDIIMG